MRGVGEIFAKFGKRWYNVRYGVCVLQKIEINDKRVNDNVYFQKDLAGLSDAGLRASFRGRCYFE